MARSKKAVWIIAVAAALSLITMSAGFVQWKASQAIKDSALAINEEQKIPFKVLRQAPQADPGFETISMPGSF
jgi:hypothetical protein